MKKINLFFLLLACFLLAGCSRILPSQFTQVTAHSSGTAIRKETDEPLTAENYASLKRAIRSLAQNGIEHGVIRVYNYEGSVEEDLPKAAYEIAREDPVGVYTIDYMTHDCSMIVSYYEIHMDMTFRDYATPVDSIEYVSGEQECIRLLRNAIDSYDDHLTVYAAYGMEPDFQNELLQYCASDPLRHMAVPELHIAHYPDGMTPSILEFTFTYPASAEALREMETRVEETMNAASVYVRYRDTETEKAQLLFTYLDERISYQQGATQTPIYSALCEGVADSESMACSWQLLCEKIGLNCQMVSGMRGGESYTWNIMELDGEFCHVDILRDLLEGGSLQIRYDPEMKGYYWDTESCPACTAPEIEEIEEIEESPEEPGEPSKPGEEQPEEPEEQDPVQEEAGKQETENTENT